MEACREIPDDIIHEILLRIPAKCLLKFQSVCKSWRDLIQSQNFINLHLNHPSQNNRSSYLVLKRSETQDSNTTLSFFSREDGGSLSTIDIPLDFHPLPPYLRGIGGPCNGIFLVGESHIAYNDNITKTCPIYLCNPATRECLKLPDCPLVARNYTHKQVSRSLGFGFDPSSHEYKVVALVSIFRFGKVLLEHRMDIFHLSSNSWREVDKIMPLIEIGGILTLDPNNRYYPVMLDGCGLFFNGHLHWRMMIIDHLKTVCILILCFNISNETKRYLSFSSDLQSLVSKGNEARRDAKLLVLTDLFSLATSVGDSDTTTCWFETWVMLDYEDEESWTKRYRIGPFIVEGGIPRPLVCWNDDMLLFQLGDGHLVSFDLREEDADQSRAHNIRGCNEADIYMGAIVMDKESLVSLSSDNLST